MRFAIRRSEARRRYFSVAHSCVSFPSGMRLINKRPSSSSSYSQELYYANTSEWIDVVRSEWLTLHRMKKQSRLAASAAEMIAADQAAAAKVAASFGSAPARGKLRRSPRLPTVKGIAVDVDVGHATGGSFGDESGDAGAHGLRNRTRPGCLPAANLNPETSRRFFSECIDLTSLRFYVTVLRVLLLRILY